MLSLYYKQWNSRLSWFSTSPQLHSIRLFIYKSSGQRILNLFGNMRKVTPVHVSRGKKLTGVAVSFPPRRRRHCALLRRYYFLHHLSFQISRQRLVLHLCRYLPDIRRIGKRPVRKTLRLLKSSRTIILGHSKATKAQGGGYRTE